MPVNPLKDAIVVGIHGIGTNDAGWMKMYDVHNMFKVKPGNVWEYVYEDELEAAEAESWKLKIANALLRHQFPPSVVGEDYYNDILIYFCNDRVADAISKEFAKFLLTDLPSDKKIVLLAHSLGSVVAYDTLFRHHDLLKNLDLDLITIGSPLSKWIVRKIRGLDDAPRAGNYALNVSGSLDPISGNVRQLRPGSDIRIFNTHDFGRYAETAARMYLASL